MQMAMKQSLCVFLFMVFIRASEASENTEAGLYELVRGDISLKLTNWGATLVSLLVPDKYGNLEDVVLGFDNIGDYNNDATYFGAIVGRVANRIGGAQFTLDGTQYHLSTNDGNNTLHGGQKGFSDVIWNTKSYIKDSHVTFEYHSFDGEQGFPGELDVSVTYMFVESDQISIRMQATPKTKSTPVNLASHSYFNLAGYSRGANVLSHTIQIFGSQITPVNAQLIPTGQILPVKGSAYDFENPREIGSMIGDMRNGYDINYVLHTKKRDEKSELKKVAILRESVSGRTLELWSNQVGVQFYTGNLIGGVKGKGGILYPKFGGLCLETQGFPDAVNQPGFPSQIVPAGETYEHIMLYKFTNRLTV